MNYFIAMAPSQGGGGAGFMSTIIMFGAIILIFYFMIIRPQQKRTKEKEKMLSNLQKGDKVMTSGGLHGTVAGLDEKTVLLNVGDNIKLKFERTAISAVISSKENS